MATWGDLSSISIWYFQWDQRCVRAYPGVFDVAIMYFMGMVIRLPSAHSRVEDDGLDVFTAEILHMSRKARLGAYNITGIGCAPGIGGVFFLMQLLFTPAELAPPVPNGMAV